MWGPERAKAVRNRACLNSAQLVSTAIGESRPEESQCRHAATAVLGVMATAEDFKMAVKDQLEQSGVLATLQAQIRAQIVNALEEGTADCKPKVPQTSDAYLLNELIREYLEFQGYRAAASVFVPEAGLSAPHRLSRQCLCDRLRVHDGPNTQQLPLLFSLLAQARSRKPLGPVPEQHAWHSPGSNA